MGPRYADKHRRLHDQLVNKLEALLSFYVGDRQAFAGLIVNRVDSMVKEADPTPLGVSELLRRYVHELDPDAWSKFEKKKKADARERR